ncbi:MAG TPA: hypothetical protein VLG41_01070 [Hydrogenophaga sp.]|uniref:hypothetical protein n=1 Tax=Hydrogenophaga sp. TaxID=1904254 RepID=UPI002B70A4E2|nr:hypothetical protein [Hydrogenophaga sp.]HSX91480.1 hypothetical protein [Hydrogenophaga sp.]
MTKSIDVPDYFADEFNKTLTYPSKKPGALDASHRRIFLLIESALKDVSWPDWEINGGEIRSTNDVEPYGIELHEGKFYIYAKERGTRSAIAIFKDGHMAAKYFVWLASKGERQIDWNLLLDMLQ